MAAQQIDTDSVSRPVENVWDYPRPAVLEPCADEVIIIFNGVEICRTRSAMRALETSHPPTFYVPMKDVQGPGVKLEAVGGGSFCEWKGSAVYYDLVVEGKRSPSAAWAYPNPTTKVNPDQPHGWANYGSGKQKGTGGSFAPIADMVAFYASRVDEAYVAGEKVKPQEGRFYGGWINSWITGGTKGIKGAPGTSHF